LLRVDILHAVVVQLFQNLAIDGEPLHRGNRDVALGFLAGIPALGRGFWGCSRRAHDVVIMFTVCAKVKRLVDLAIEKRFGFADTDLDGALTSHRRGCGVRSEPSCLLHAVGAKVPHSR
jgi:hypothetical protein